MDFKESEMSEEELMYEEGYSHGRRDVSYWINKATQLGKDKEELEDINRDFKEQVYYLTGDCLNFKGKIAQLKEDKAELAEKLKELYSFIMARNTANRETDLVLKSIEELLK